MIEDKKPFDLISPNVEFKLKPIAQREPTPEEKAWLSAATEGDHLALDAALARGQAIDQCIAGQTALQAAIKANQHQTIIFLLERKANPAVLTPHGTALITAIQMRNLPAFERILALPAGKMALNKVHIDRDLMLMGTSTYETSEACYLPSTYLCAAYEKSKDQKEQATLSKMLQKSLAARPPLVGQAGRALLDELLAFYTLYADPAQPLLSRYLLNYVTACLTAQDLIKTLAGPSLEGRAIATLICALLNIQASTQDQQKLPEGWQHEPFLTLRTSCLFALLKDLKIGTEPVPTEWKESREALANRLTQAVLVDLEMLRTALEIRAIPYKERNLCNSILAQRCVETIAALPTGAEFALATGWEGHAIYVSWMKDNAHVLWRVDNLNQHEQKYHPVKAPSKDMSLRMQSALLGQYNITDFKKPEYKQYFVGFVENFQVLPDRTSGIQLVYEVPKSLPGRNSVPSSHEIYSFLPYCTVQAESNCYAKSHEPGFHIRLGSHLLTYVQEKEQKNVVGWNIKCTLPLQQGYLLDSDRQLPTHLLEMIRRHYQSLSQVKRLFADSDDVGQPIAESFINLSIVKESSAKDAKFTEIKEDLPAEGDEKAIERKSEHKQIPYRKRELLLASYQDIYPSQRQPVVIGDIWKQVPTNATRRHIVMAGRAGIGKSTLCQYIVHQWAQNSLWSPTVAHLFWIRLRDLKRYATTTVAISLVQVVEDFCLPARVQLTDEQRRLVQEKIDKGEVLWLLDGYDEIVESMRTQPALAKLLQMLYQQPQLLLTSRPHTVHDIIRVLPEAVQLEICGFTDDNVKAFIDKFFSEPQQAAQGKTLKAFLKRHPDVGGLVHVPINLELICSFWQADASRQEIGFTSLYQELIKWLMMRDARRNNIDLGGRSIDNVYEKEQKVLAEAAFTAMENHEILIPEQSLKAIVAKYQRKPQDRAWLCRRVEELGVLRKTVSRQLDDQPDYYFIHLTFQEYYAARYIVNAYIEDENSVSHKEILAFTARYKYNPTYQIVWWFVAGILGSENPDYLSRFLNQLARAPREIVPTMEWNLWLRCLNEAGIPDSWSSTKTIVEALAKWNKRTIKIYASHHGSRYYEGREENSWSRSWGQLIQSSSRIVKQVGFLPEMLEYLRTTKEYKKSPSYQESSPAQAWISILNPAIGPEYIDVLLEILFKGKLPGAHTEILTILSRLTSAMTKDQIAKSLQIALDYQSSLWTALMPYLSAKQVNVKLSSIFKLISYSFPTQEIIKIIPYLSAKQVLDCINHLYLHLSKQDYWRMEVYNRKPLEESATMLVARLLSLLIDSILDLCKILKIALRDVNQAPIALQMLSEIAARLSPEQIDLFLADSIDALTEEKSTSVYRTHSVSDNYVKVIQLLLPHFSATQSNVCLNKIFLQDHHDAVYSYSNIDSLKSAFKQLQLSPEQIKLCLEAVVRALSLPPPKERSYNEGYKKEYFLEIIAVIASHFTDAQAEFCLRSLIKLVEIKLLQENQIERLFPLLTSRFSTAQITAWLQHLLAIIQQDKKSIGGIQYSCAFYTAASLFTSTQATISQLDTYLAVLRNIWSKWKKHPSLWKQSKRAFEIIAPRLSSKQIDYWINNFLGKLRIHQTDSYYAEDIKLVELIMSRAAAENINCYLTYLFDQKNISKQEIDLVFKKLVPKLSTAQTEFCLKKLITTLVSTKLLSFNEMSMLEMILPQLTHEQMQGLAEDKSYLSSIINSIGEYQTSTLARSILNKLLARYPFQIEWIHSYLLELCFKDKSKDQYSSAVKELIKMNISHLSEKYIYEVINMLITKWQYENRSFVSEVLVILIPKLSTLSLEDTQLALVLKQLSDQRYLSSGYWAKDVDYVLKVLQACIVKLSPPALKEPQWGSLLTLLESKDNNIVNNGAQVVQTLLPILSDKQKQRYHDKLSTLWRAKTDAYPLMVNALSDEKLVSCLSETQVKSWLNFFLKSEITYANSCKESFQKALQLLLSRAKDWTVTNKQGADVLIKVVKAQKQEGYSYPAKYDDYPLKITELFAPRILSPTIASYYLENFHMMTMKESSRYKEYFGLIFSYLSNECIDRISVKNLFEMMYVNKYRKEEYEFFSNLIISRLNIQQINDCFKMILTILQDKDKPAESVCTNLLQAFMPQLKQTDIEQCFNFCFLVFKDTENKNHYESLKAVRPMFELLLPKLSIARLVDTLKQLIATFNAYYDKELLIKIINIFPLSELIERLPDLLLQLREKYIYKHDAYHEEILGKLPLKIIISLYVQSPDAELLEYVGNRLLEEQTSLFFLDGVLHLQNAHGDETIDISSTVLATLEKELQTIYDRDIGITFPTLAVPETKPTTVLSFDFFKSKGKSSSSEQKPREKKVVVPAPSHEALMACLVKALGLDDPEPVYSGILVEQSLVGLTGISTVQTGAQFRHAEEGCTQFKLRLASSREADQFKQYYDRHHPGFIVKMNTSGTFTNVLVDTNILYQTISLKIGTHYISNVTTMGLFK